jgi:hypothetical protein
VKQQEQGPTPDRDDATTGRHYQDGKDKVGVGCLIKVWPAPADQPGKHAINTPSAVAS